MTPLLLSVFPTFAIGGAQSRFTTIANHLGPSWRHAIIAMDGVTTARERFEPSIEVTFPTVEVRKGDLLGNLRRFGGAIRALGPRTMLTHNFGSIEWAMATRVSLVQHVHVEDGFGPDEQRKQLPRRVWLRRAFLSRRKIILPSRNLMRIALESWRFSPRWLHYVPNGIDTTRFTTRAPQPSNEGLVIGTVAALRPEKNIGRLIRAFHSASSNTSAKLVIVGDGPQRAELEALAATLNLKPRVHFAGHVAKPESLLSSFDIFAMSSDTEQMPISLLEAMATGLPAVATDVGDIASMLPEIGKAFITPCDDLALATSLRTLMQDHQLRAKLGQASRLKAEAEFDQSSMFSRWASLIEGNSLVCDGNEK